MQSISILTMVTLLVIAGGIVSLSITGQPSVNGTLGGNVPITWKVQNFIHTKWLIYASNTEDKNQLLTIDNQNCKKNKTFGKAPNGIHDNLRNRSSATYYYTGNFEGQETGQVVLIIRDLKFEDSDRFILRDGEDLNDKSPTKLSVYYGPEICGSDLESEYNANEGNQLNVTMTFCGKPQPTVTWKFDGQSYTSVSVTVGANQYNYTFHIPTSLKLCGTKQLSCTATGHGKPVKRQTNVVGKSPDEKKVSDGVCAGHIVGVQVGVIVMCVFIYLYLTVWKATDETGKRVGFIIAVFVGLALVIGMILSYADLRKTIDNHNCGKGSWKVCDIYFTVFGGIDIVGTVVVVGFGVLKCMKEDKTMKVEDDNGRINKTEEPSETPEQVANEDVPTVTQTCRKRSLPSRGSKYHE